MTTTLQRGSAKIYEFPMGGRAALRSRRDEARPAPELAAPQPARIVHGGGWYHEAAVEEAEQARRRS